MMETSRTDNFGLYP